MSKHKTKLAKIFEHPISGNIDITKLTHALEHYGVEVDVSKKHRLLLHFAGKEHSVSLSHNNELHKDAVVALRHFLEEVNLTPEKLD
ncbi:hypothetical protein [Sulfurimonas microaerophilic]|uniref:hypothetical protein n=1 Tax=Sulfurimonas microaerophilic TaxID=3058392 RepID=UPI002714FAA9|nr:hypothetical protein [Sulfurimonas sp. hsl 1-7]